jgi:zinc transport system ATP-binding protein
MISGSPALEVEHLTIRVGETPLITDLSFSVPRATSLAVIGPNGAGKTMLFRALVGAIPYDGRVRWAPGTRIGYVPQKLDLDRSVPITGADLLAARTRLSGIDRGRIAPALARVGLSAAVLRQLIGTLSGGQFQRLLVAFALLGDPTVLLLDEPTAGVDQPGQERFHETIRRLQSEEGVTVLLISHELNVVFRDATNVLCMSREHRCFGVPRQVLTSDVLTQIYGEPVGLYRHDHADR